MSAYQLKKPHGSYDLIDLNFVNMTNQIVSNSDHSFDGVVKRLMALPDDNTSILELWAGTFSCHYFPQAKLQIFDINVLTNFLVLTQPSYLLLGDRLRPYGEFVRVEADGEPLMLFNPLVFGQEDKSLCEVKFLDGYEDGLKILAFDEQDIANKLVFKSKLQGGYSIFCNDSFKRLILDSELEGITFDPDLINIF